MMARRSGKPLAAALAESGPTFSAPALPDSITVDMGQGEEPTEGMMVDINTGEVTAGDPPEEEAADEDFYKNLAEGIDEDELGILGRDILDLVEQDEKGHDKWYATVKRGFAALGIYSDTEESAGDVTDINKTFHPLILEAATQFQARAMAELLPPGGPVKGSLIGKKTEEKMEQADRVQDYMNYQLTVEDRGYYDDKDQLFYRLGFTGSEFDKQWFDPVKRKNRSRWVKCENFIVPMSTSSLEDAPRYAEKLPMTKNNYKKMVKAKFYREVELTAGVDAEKNVITAEVEKIQGEDGIEAASADENYTFVEVHIDYEVPGDEDPDGIARPYIVTIDKDSSKVLSIYRNWDEEDPAQEKRIWYTHKKFLPGLGFYGWGLFHCIGALGETATQIVNLLLDAGAFSALQGGFKTKEGGKLRGDMQLTPGEYKDIEATYDEISKAFYTPPYREPSPTLFQLLGAVVDMGQRFAATTDTMVGDAASTGPVGTTVALIEQGSKVYTGIHKRLHKAMGDEFIHLAALNSENLPEQYPYQTDEDDGQYVLREDFDGRVDVVPVSDPNIFSSAQRLAQAQAIYQMAMTGQSGIDQREAAAEMLKAMRVGNIDKLMPEPAQAPYADPLTEGALVVMGRPIKAFSTQNHGAHDAVHQMQLQQFQQMGNAQAVQQMLAHLQEHMAMGLFMQYQQQLQAALPPMNWGAEKTDQLASPVPPEVENQIAMRAAQMAQQVMQQLQQQAAQQQGQPQGGASPQEAQQALAQKDQEFQQSQQHKDIAFQKDQQRKDAGVQADVQRQNAQTQADIAREDFVGDSELKIDPELLQQAKQYVEQTGLQIPPKKLAAASQVLGKPFAEVIQALSIMMMGGQGQGPAPIAASIAKRS